MKKILRSKWALSFLSGCLVFLSFPTFGVFPLIFLFPIFLNALTERCEGFVAGLVWGFITSFFIMVGAFYWVIYVLHEFGYVPWWLASILFLGFCGFGALNFPLYVGAATWIRRRIYLPAGRSWQTTLWYALALPSLFTLLEYGIPKLFPWYIGHCLYRTPWLIQIAEVTGETFLTFSIVCAGSVAGAKWLEKKRVDPRIIYFPIALWVLCLGFSVVRLNQDLAPSKPFRFTMIQGNVSSLQKRSAETGVADLATEIVKTYTELTDVAVKEHRPQLILWPETAMPFNLGIRSTRAEDIRFKVRGWKTPLITGGFAVDPHRSGVEYNAAYLLEPNAKPAPKLDVYYKNVLLAFGEYMPLGETFPFLYRIAPEVSHFGRGKTQKAFTLADDTRVGITICYEAILPEFVRKVAAQNIQLLVNLTNDSWFGPTAEPYLHGAISIFRAIEHRVPFLRVTNTGTTFYVDRLGYISTLTETFEAETLSGVVDIPKIPPHTLYARFGDSFIFFCLMSLIGVILACASRR